MDPLWAGENKFLLLNFNKLKYDKVNYTQFTNANWIKKHSVPPEAVKILLKKFQIQANIDQMQPVINSVIQDGQVAATGIPYFVNYYDSSRNKIPWFNLQRQGWNGNGNQWYDHRDNRFNYQFLKEFRQTFHFNNNPQNATQAKSLNTTN